MGDVQLRYGAEMSPRNWRMNSLGERLTRAHVVAALAVILSVGLSLVFFNTSFDPTGIAGDVSLLLFLPLLIFVPGYALAGLFLKRFTGEERIALGFCLSTALLAAVGLIDYFVGFAQAVLINQIVSIFMILGGTFVIIRSKLYADFFGSDKFGLGVMLVVFFFANAFANLPYQPSDLPFMAFPYPWVVGRTPFLPGDPTIPFSWAILILNQLRDFSLCCGWSLTDRTPLMGLVSAFVLAATRTQTPVNALVVAPVPTTSFLVFRTVGTFLDSMVVLPAYMLLKRLFSQPIARASIIFVALNPFIIWQQFYTSPKSMAAFFILFAYLLVLDKRYSVSGMILGLGYLSHQYAVFFALGITAYSAISRNSFRQGFSRLAGLASFVAAFALSISPWEVWTNLAVGRGSRFFTYAFESNLAPTITLSIWARIQNEYGSFFPRALGEIPSANTWPLIGAYSSLASQVAQSPVLAALTLNYITSLVGALTFTMWIPAYYFWANRILHRDRFWLTMVFLPIVATVAIFPQDLFGLADVFAVPVVPLLYGLAISSVSATTRRILFVGLLIEHSFLLWSIMYPFNLLFTRLSSPVDGLQLLLVGICYAIIFRLALTAV